MDEERERFSKTLLEAQERGVVCPMHAIAGWTACDCPGKASWDCPEKVSVGHSKTTEEELPSIFEQASNTAHVHMGHNNPPSQAEFAIETAQTIGQWLKEHPVIQTEEEAKEYKLLRDRGKCCLADMEDERKSRVRPLQGQIGSINDEYRDAGTILESALGTGDDRVNVWIRQEEEKRRKIKEEAWRKVQEAEETLRAATEREYAAKEEAAMGVESDVLGVARDTDVAEAALLRSTREAMRAERGEAVKVTGGHRRALSVRQKVEFIISDPILTVKDVGWSERTLRALESDVREYYHKFSTVPKGVQISTERKVQ